MKNLGKNLLAVAFGCILSLLLAELILRIYNPMPSRVRGEKIQLKTNLSKQVVLEDKFPGLDATIQYSLNSIGFRGEEPPQDFQQHFTLFTVGGSTTECSLLDDAKTWPALLGERLKALNPKVWVNNAGIDGCSTYGHLILLDDYLLDFHPDMIVFLIGVNDRGKATFESEDGFLINRRESFLRSLIKRSELANLMHNLYQSYRAQKVQLGHGNVPAKGIQRKDISLAERKEKLAVHEAYLPAYRKRVENIVERCKANQIIPVLVTQPLLSPKESLGWEIMQKYNEVTLEVANQNQVPSVDLGGKLEKNTAFYYDNMHYTNAGAARVAAILFEDLRDWVPQDM